MLAVDADHRHAGAEAEERDPAAVWRPRSCGRVAARESRAFAGRERQEVEGVATGDDDAAAVGRGNRRRQPKILQGSRERRSLPSGDPKRLSAAGRERIESPLPVAVALERNLPATGGGLVRTCTSTRRDNERQEQREPSSSPNRSPRNADG